jgi:DNA relaxase NicK
MPSKATATIDNVYAGVDWISATLGREELDNQVWLYDAIHALEGIAERGNTYKRRSLLGFDGWESAGCFVGSNETRHYAQFAGENAHGAFHFLDHPKVHISRIDVQLTVQYSEELLKLGRKCYASAIRHNQSLPEHRRRRIHLYAGSDFSDTVYLGSASSDTRGRIYNKDKQSQDRRYERAWRYEVVYRNEYANGMFRRLAAAPDETTKLITQEVVAYFSQRGVSVLGLRNWDTDTTKVPKQDRTDAARKLRWIETQVVPTIRKLAEMGYAEELMIVIAEAIAAARNSQL